MRFFSLALLCLFSLCAPAFAIDIKSVKTKGGLEAWLVEDHSIPIIAMKFSFEPGTTSDPAGKEGVTNFLTAMMDEGAGDLTSEAFVAQRDALGMKMGYEAGVDYFTGSFQTLAKNREASFALLKLALTQTRFDADAVERMRAQLIVMAEQSLQDPGEIASKNWMAAVFGSRPYGRSDDGSADTLRTITADDLRALQKRLFSRKALKIAIVGDISAADAARLIDATFGSLPDTAPVTVAETPMATIPAAVRVVSFDNPQSVIMFGGKGVLRNDPEFLAAYVATHILGEGGFGSRLMNEVRVKRGLTYGIGYGLVPMKYQGLTLGSVSTRNEKVGEVLETLRSVIHTYGQTGPTAEELKAAKTFLTGSYPLRFDSSSKIAGVLLGFQQENLGIDYTNRRNQLVEALTLDQVQTQAKRIYGEQNLNITIVGKPEGVPAPQK